MNVKGNKKKQIQEEYGTWIYQRLEEEYGFLNR
jgi:hypothetical protein